jgi:hypothetical protein
MLGKTKITKCHNYYLFKSLVLSGIEGNTRHSAAAVSSAHLQCNSWSRAVSAALQNYQRTCVQFAILQDRQLLCGQLADLLAIILSAVYVLCWSEVAPKKAFKSAVRHHDQRMCLAICLIEHLDRWRQEWQSPYLDSISFADPDYFDMIQILFFTLIQIWIRLFIFIQIWIRSGLFDKDPDPCCFEVLMYLIWYFIFILTWFSLSVHPLWPNQQAYIVNFVGLFRDLRTLGKGIQIQEDDTDKNGFRSATLDSIPFLFFERGGVGYRTEDS